MGSLLVHGTVETNPAADELLGHLPGDLKARPKYRADLDLARAGGTPQTLEVEDGDLVELDLGEGLRLWSTVAQLREDFPAGRARGDETEPFALPRSLDTGFHTRGAAEWLIKGLRIVGIDIAEDITDFVGSHVEGKLQPGPGLFRCSPGGAEELGQLQTGSIDPQQPYLLFLHGTASTTQGSFGGLWEAADGGRMDRLAEHYGKRILAFQHRTLTQSPVENAIELARSLPAGARLHLVSHSRGGLVGELLCRGMMLDGIPFDRDELTLLTTLELPEQHQALAELGALLAEKRFRIERFARVACPARGTTLASRRLDRYLSLIVNTLNLVGMDANPVYDAFATLLVGVVKKRTDPSELPGIEAMMPESPLVRILNRPGRRCGGALHVLGGDIQASGILGRLKVMATNLFYREDHDLVVNTPAMFGGAEREGGMRYWIDHGARVDHFSYFRNADTAERLLQVLLRPDSADLRPMDKHPADISASDYRKRTTRPQPVVFVVPGIMGSHLKAGNRRIWLDMLQMALGGLGKLSLEADQVEPDGLIGKCYRELLRFLGNSHEVIPFPYDWRRSVAESAEELRQTMARQLPAARRHGLPVRILAHSMGGLVVRAMLASDEGRSLWEEVGEIPGSRLLMLGTPNGGAHAIVAMLMGRDRMLEMLSMLDFSTDQAGLLAVVSGFPGVMELLPRSASGSAEHGRLDLFQPQAWALLQHHDFSAQRGQRPNPAKSSGIVWEPPSRAGLEAADALWTRLERVRFDPRSSAYVAGVAPATAVDVRIDPDAAPGRQVIVDASEHGDGRVPWATGVPQELSDQTWYMNASHGDLTARPEHFPALLELLQSGTTEKLSRTPPARRSSPREHFEMPVESPQMYPSQDQLLAAAMGGTELREGTGPEPKVRVRVIHGNLAYAEGPVAVGHYQGDTIVSAEAYLDRVLEGRLRERQQLGLYPGPLNTAQVFLPRRKGDGGPVGHPGAVVMGLGRVGELSPGNLAGGFARAAVLYAAEALDLQHRERQGRGTPGSGLLPLTLCTLLIGTGAGGFRVEDSLQAILEGVHDANRRLQNPDPTAEIKGGDGKLGGARISELHILELYEDRAIHAARALQQLGGSARHRAAFELDEVLVSTRQGGRRRVYFEEDPTWWQRLRIEVREDDAMRFDAVTARARAESYLRPTQRKLVESFLDQASGSTQTDPSLCQTLFDLLLPNSLKERAPDRHNLVLVLNDRAAAYPWELLHDRLNSGSRPLAVEAGLIRQLTTLEFRQEVHHDLERHALVVGDPVLGDSSFPALPGARQEALEVARRLRTAGYEVTELIGGKATPVAVLRALYEKPYRIVHLAGHGVFEYPLPGDASDPCKVRTATGMVLGGELFLTPAEIDQMRYTPELIFVNCCHLGQAGGEHRVRYHRLAANVSTQLIRMGARAVVAAGWAVVDDAAKTFAGKFYEEFLDAPSGQGGRPFGQAVQRAREETYTRHGGSNTWGAYQCYGDHDFRLRRGPARGAPELELRPVAAAELLVELENLAQKAGTADPAHQAELSESIERISRTLPSGWLASARMHSALARAYAELQDLEPAIEHYQEAVRLHPADASLRDAEQLANLRGRRALECDDAQRADELLKSAQEEIDALLVIGATSERHTIKAGIHKRRAILYLRRSRKDNDPERRTDGWAKQLAQARASYRRAMEPRPGPDRSADGDPQDRAYAWQNWLTLEILAALAESEEPVPTEISDSLEQLEQTVEAFPNAGSNYWRLAMGAEVKLLRCLLQRRITANRAEEIGQALIDARRRSGSPRELSSTLLQLEFLQAILRASPKLRQRKSLANAVGSIRKQLED